MVFGLRLGTSVLFTSSTSDLASYRTIKNLLRVDDHKNNFMDLALPSAWENRAGCVVNFQLFFLVNIFF